MGLNPLSGLSKTTRNRVVNVIKLLITVAGFWLLLTHEVGTWMKGDHGVYFAPVEGEVAGFSVDGAAMPRAASLEALHEAGASGWVVEGDLLYVRLADGSAPQSHQVAADGQPDLGRIPIALAIRGYVSKVDPGPFIVWSLVAMAVKFTGVLSSAFGWYLLLKGQRVVFPYWQQVITGFLIGRFIGTFLPSTIGLDGYTLYEAGRYSNQWHRVITAKALEKFIGIAGLFTGLLLTLPAGYPVLHALAGDRTPVLVGVIAVLCGSVTGVVVVGLAWPRALRGVLDTAGRFVPGPIRHHLARFTDAASAYHGRLDIVFGALLAKFVTHSSTAVVYYFTALAIGVVGVQFLPIVFGSLIQILGTLFSPTIAGEGAREALQALLLSHYLGGAAQAVLSAALGFIAAEAATLWGGAFLWVRNPQWRPTFVLVDGRQVDYAWLEGDQTRGFDAALVERRTREDASAAG